VGGKREGEDQEDGSRTSATGWRTS